MIFPREPYSPPNLAVHVALLHFTLADWRPPYAGGTTIRGGRIFVKNASAQN